MDPNFFPVFPELTDEVKTLAREHQTYLPIAFDYFRYSCAAAASFACIESTSPGWNLTSQVDLAVIRGNLSRIGHLGNSVIQLSHDGDSLETVLILNRSIMESAINLRWCIHKDPPKRFYRFLEAGVQADLELRNNILANTSKTRQELLIEQRMLKSIDKLANKCGFKWEESWDVHRFSSKLFA
jgi:hypothetical protein